MAGSEVASVSISSSDLEKSTAGDLQIAAIIDQWQVEYSRFINYSSFNCKRTHPSLSPITKKRPTSGTWLSTAAASLKITYHRSSTGLDSAVIVLSLRSGVLEEHYLCKMHFSWPQVSCVSGFPGRGSRAVFVSYKDGVGQVRKFALRFSTNYETERFMNIVKEILETESPPLLLGPQFNSALSSQADAISSDGPTKTNDVNWQCETSEDNSTQLFFARSDVNEAQDSVSHETIGDDKIADEMPVFPPSFTQLMKNCHPAVSEAKPTESVDDLKTQFMQYLEGTSFKELLATVENVVSVLEADMVL
ncbi:hypothetical protein OROGR_002136 [Orobanche gracilis]